MTKADLMILAAGYDLIARTVLAGPRGETRATLASMPELTPLLQDQPQEELLADHYALFGLGVPPFANVYISADGMAGGEAAERLARFYTQIGFKAPPDAPGMDHLGVVLLALCHALLTEIEMHRHAESEAAERARTAQRHLLDQELCPWLWPLLFAVQNEPYPLYDHLLQALIQIMTDHRARLGGETPRAAAPVTACPLFEHEETDLAAIAAYLTTPARSGLYLTRRDLQELAVKAELPRSFGESRATSLVTIIKTAARFERLPKLWSELIRWFDEAARRYQAVEPALRWAAEPWQQRAEATAAGLKEAGRQIEGMCQP